MKKIITIILLSLLAGCGNKALVKRVEILERKAKIFDNIKESTNGANYLILPYDPTIQPIPYFIVPDGINPVQMPAFHNISPIPEIYIEDCEINGMLGTIGE